MCLYYPTHFFKLNIVDCQWSPWSDPGCSAKCGATLNKTLTRKVEQKAAYGGKQCIGNPEKIVNCGLKECPGTKT